MKNTRNLSRFFQHFMTQNTTFQCRRLALSFKHHAMPRHQFYLFKHTTFCRCSMTMALKCERESVCGLYLWLFWNRIGKYHLPVTACWFFAHLPTHMHAALSHPHTASSSGSRTVHSFIDSRCFLLVTPTPLCDMCDLCTNKISRAICFCFYCVVYPPIVWVKWECA